MVMRIKSDLDYEKFCNELGITLEDLINLQQQKSYPKINTPQVKTNILISEAITKFKDHLVILNKGNKRSDSTLSTYTNFLDRFNKFIQDKDAKITVDKLNEELLMEMLNISKPRKDETLSVRTINKYVSILRKLIFFCFDKDFIERDYRYRFTINNVDSLPRYLSNSQLQLVLKKALQRTYGYRCRAMIIFLAGTGCRVSELVNMRVKDFNINEKLIYVYNGKGKKDRVIPMFKEVEKAILHYLRLSGIKEWNNYCEGFLFCRDEGDKREKNLTVNSVQYLVRNIFKEMNLNKDYTVHSFRHSFSVNCLKAGIPLHYLTQILGHDDPKTTQIYLKLHPVDLKEEVNKHYPFPFENLLKELFL
jgi:site-specific recombinase XerD